ncbi:MAG TPA: hypothetical protein VH054_08055 [Polyangiaceae bacterium]|jgi:hypothetical protein|nr:hypothetical protein [Polyangiaceae bacterium]
MDDVVTLAPMFATGEALVQRIVDQLARFATTPTLRKTQTISPADASRALDVAFWASVTSNEGRATRARILFVEPQMLPSPLRFDTAIAYEPARITRLAPAVPEGGCIGVSPSTMMIWGMTAVDPGSSINALEIAVPSPGVLHVRIGPLRPFCVVSDGAAIVLSDAALKLPERLRELLGKSLVGDIKKTQRAWRECLIVAALARRILRRGTGGALLFVPTAHGDWTRFVDIAYRFASPDATLRDAVASEIDGIDARAFAPEAPEALKWQAVGDAPGHLSAEAAALRRVAPYAEVDGAVVVTRELEIVGFGAKIVAPAQTSHVLVGDELVSIEDTGGTRHQSAARFVAASSDCAATVISHDGHVSLLHWDRDHDAVRMIRNVEWWD